MSSILPLNVGELTASIDSSCYSHFGIKMSLGCLSAKTAPTNTRALNFTPAPHASVSCTQPHKLCFDFKMAAA